ncbi:hypothetical protein ABVK25_003619 [Lepraria finkii]|uniref:Uncharacterized protein n=1 Tax=Lepraria finkii TaxID=1340010 RepID=A0ABR4BDQ2_9LECA
MSLAVRSLPTPALHWPIHTHCVSSRPAIPPTFQSFSPTPYSAPPLESKKPVIPITIDTPQQRKHRRNGVHVFGISVSVSGYFQRCLCINDLHIRSILDGRYS